MFIVQNFFLFIYYKPGKCALALALLKFKDRKVDFLLQFINGWKGLVSSKRNVIY